LRKLNPSRQAGVRIGGLVTVVGAGWKALSLLGDVIELPGKLQPLSDAILAHPGVFPWVLVLVGVASIAAGYYWPRKGPTEGGPPYQPHHVSQTHSGAGHNIVAGSISFENSDRDLAQSRFAQFRDELLQGTKGKTYTIEHSMSDAEAMLSGMGEAMTHLHIADGTGLPKDEHLVPGRGNQPCAEILRTLAARDFDGNVIVEVNTRRAPSREEREADLAEALTFCREQLAPSAHPG